MITSRSISHPSRTGLALVAISFLLSFIPFQGKNLTTSKERTSAQTEVVAKGTSHRKRALVFSYVSSERSTSGVVSFSCSLVKIHSLQSELRIRDLRKHIVPDLQHHQLNSIFVGETEDYIA